MREPADIIWRGSRIPRLVLGTAQLGGPYGIANTLGRPAHDRATEIVRTAWDSGVRFFDTAQAYGASEEVLGRALRELGVDDQAKVISKLSPDLPPRDSDRILEAVRGSCRRLGVPQLWALLLHRASWLDMFDEGLGLALRKARDGGFVVHLGVSVYTVDEARRALEHSGIDVVQLPCNAWDQKMLREGLLGLARSRDKLCFVRSVYLQGLLLMPRTLVAERLPRARGASERWHAIAARIGATPKELAVRFALSLAAPLVVGAEGPGQVRENSRLLRLAPLGAEEADSILDEMAPLLSEAITDPSSWQREDHHPPPEKTALGILGQGRGSRHG